MTGFPRWTSTLAYGGRMAIPTLPQEILEKILDELGPTKDRKTLVSCSIVSSSFREPSQKRLFSSLVVTLHSRKRVSRREGLYLFLASNPHIAASVRTLSLGLWGPRMLVGAPVLRLLTNLKSLAVYTLELQYNDWKEMHVPNELKQDLHILMGFTSLQRVELRNVNHFPLEFLIHTPNLKELVVSGYGRLGTSTDTSLVRMPQKHLEALQVVFPIVLQQLSALADPHPLSLSHLRSFNGVASNGDSGELVQRLFNMSAASLQRLVLLIYVTEESCLNLSCLQNLRHLSLTLNNPGKEHKIWFRALESIAETNQIAEIILRLASPPRSHEPWQYLDELLSRDRHITPLRRVVLELKAAKSVIDVELPAAIRTNMSKLCSKGVLLLRYASES